MRRRTSGRAAAGVAPMLAFFLITARMPMMVRTEAGLSTPAQLEKGIYQPSCRSALGMESKKIPDSAITSSSYFDLMSVGPINSRIRTEKSGGAWCPKEQISQDIYEWLQIDLGELKVITLVETQGRWGNGQGMEYATSYMLEYQREDGGRWVRFRDRKGQEKFQGNGNTYIVEMREVRPLIIARRIRFVPYSRYPRTVCMRVELHGCKWKDGVVSYSMRQGDRRGAEVDLYDFTYDGQVQDGYLSGGLGQLTDWEEGITNFRLDVQNLGKKGYEWIGWKNDTLGTPPVEIAFQFDRLRNFSAIKLHCNNQFSKDVRVFSLAKVYFSVGGSHFTADPILYKYYRDNLMEFARFVTIPIPHVIGQYVKIVLYFDSRWLMLSEVKFESTPVYSGNFTEEPLPPATPSLAQGATTPTVVHLPDVVPAGSPTGKPELKHRGPQVLEVDIMPEDSQDDKRESNDTQTEATPDGSEYNPDHPRRNIDDTYIGVIIGALAALILLLLMVVIIIFVRHRRLKFSGGNPLKVFGSEHVNFNINELKTGLTNNGKVSCGNMYNPVSTNEQEVDCSKEFAMEKFAVVQEPAYREPQDCIQSRKLPDVPPKTPEGSTDTNLSGMYASPDLTQFSPLVVSLPPNPVFQQPLNNLTTPREESPPPPPPPPPPHARSMTAAVDMVNIQGLSGNSVYAVPNPDLLWKENLSIHEFPRDKLSFIEQLGEGQFGEVHLCEAIKMTDALGDDFPVVDRGGCQSMLVAVKTLQPDASAQARADFNQEVQIMSRLKDPNIVRVLGVCTREEPMAVVVEYMQYGDVHQFLLDHVPEGTVNQHNEPVLSYGCLIYMATQMASGMKYLETLNMVHRDLATRNCLVGALYTIKISDFGMSRSLYSSDYYRIEGKAVLPIRWMAWESVLLGKFSCKSDVWSFAVSLWEILTLCREQPFDALSDEQVIENCGHYYRNDAAEVYLPQPSNCPKEIFDLMRECWNRDETQRPTFREIHMFLQRKNMGYNPRDELSQLEQ